MHFTKFTVLAIIGLAMASPLPNDRGSNDRDDGDTTTTTCSNSQSTVCCDKSGKNCNVKNSCSNDQIQMCGNTVSVPLDLGIGIKRMLKRTDGNRDDEDGDTTTTTCSNSQSTMCCNKSGKNCEIKDSCSNSQSQICGNVLSLDLGGIGLGRRDGRGGNNDDDGDTTTTTCSNNQSTMCCDKSGKNCKVSSSCGNSQVQFCGNSVSVPVTVDLSDVLGGLRRRTDRNDNDDGETTTTTCSNNQSTMCCNKSGKNCKVSDSCSNDQIQICGNSVSVPITVDAGDMTCLLGGC